MDSALFLALFDGYGKRHIETVASGTKSDSGKMKAKTETVEGPLTPELVVDHLNGGKAIGVAPVRADSTCVFGVLDVDWYDMPEDDVRACAERLRTRCAAFRTKSRGLHIYVFVDAPISGRHMHEYLVALRKRLPKKVAAKTELFPKHSQIVVTPTNEPTAVNLPMNGQARELAWVINDEGVQYALDDVQTPDDIMRHIDERCRVDHSTVEQIAKETPTLDHSDMGYKVPHDPAGRNDLLMRIGMSMQARGWPDVELEAELRRLNGDENFHELFSAGPISDSEIVAMLRQIKKREKGTPTPLHYREVEKFNRRWSKITIHGNVEYLDKEASEFTTFTKQNLFDETSDQVVRVGNSMMLVAQAWLRDPDHARFVGVVVEPLDYDGPAYNVWRGFQVTPKDGDASIFESYVRDVLCGGDEGLAHWVTMFLADIVQRPTEPSPPTAIAMRGPQGAGKSFLQERILTPILGPRYVQKVDEAERLFSRFNRSLFGTTVIACEESIFHGSAQMASKLKSFISSPSWTYEEKHKATMQAKNVSRIIATTNNEQAVHIDLDDRRWTVIEVAQPFDLLTEEGKAEARAIWEPYHAFVRSENGLGIILRYLLDYPVDRNALLFGYGTAAKARDKVSSDPVLAVLHEIAETGVCPHDLPGVGVVSITSLHEAVKAAGGRMITPEEVSHRVSRLVPQAERCRTARYVERVLTSKREDGSIDVDPLTRKRQRGFAFGDLKAFQASVARITQCEYDVAEWQSWAAEDFDFTAAQKHVADPEDDRPF